MDAHHSIVLKLFQHLLLCLSTCASEGVGYMQCAKLEMLSQTLCSSTRASESVVCVCVWGGGGGMEECNQCFALCLYLRCTCTVLLFACSIESTTTAMTHTPF